MQELQKKLIDWANKNFNRTDTVDPLLGVSEEVGELNHHYLKQKQGIRINEDHIAGMKDSVADIVIYLIDFCDRMGWDFYDIFKNTVENEVLIRDWNKNKESGK